MFHHWRQFALRAFCGIAICAVTAPAFQNCSGKAGTTLDGNMSGTVNKALASAPIPVQMNINQISLMTCANAGTTSTYGADPTDNPFYHIRFGAYNNALTTASGGWPAGVFQSSTPKTPNNYAGIGFSTDAITFLTNSNSGVPPSATQLQTYLTSSPYTSSAAPMAGIIYQNNARSYYLAPTFGSSSAPIAKSLLSGLSSTSLQNSLINQPLISNAGTLPSGFFPNVGGAGGTLLADLNFPITVPEQISSVLGSSQTILYLGFTAGTTSDPASMIQNMATPDSSINNGRLFGVGYHLSPYAPTSSPDYFYVAGVNQVQEYNLDPSSGTQAENLTVTQGQYWNCTAFPIVRNIDRKFWTIPYGPGSTNAPINIDLATGAPNCSSPSWTVSVNASFVQSIAGAATSSCAQFNSGTVVLPFYVSKLGGIQLQENYFVDAAQVSKVQTNLFTTFHVYQSVFNGTLKACPTEDPSTYTPAMLDQLAIMRRFLGGNLWEINIAQGCVVPTPAALSGMGQCYDGDADTTKLVQYAPDSSNTCGNGVGTTYAACAATVSFCMRYY